MKLENNRVDENDSLGRASSPLKAHRNDLIHVYSGFCRGYLLSKLDFNERPGLPSLYFTPWNFMTHILDSFYYMEGGKPVSQLFHKSGQFYHDLSCCFFPPLLLCYRFFLRKLSLNSRGHLRTCSIGS